MQQLPAGLVENLMDGHLIEKLTKAFQNISTGKVLQKETQKV